jgi:MFS transporter, FLVCR family, MFS-domain-containing protein 7
VNDQQPYGYGSTISGLFGAALLGAGLIAAVISGPVFDRVLTNHLALCIKLLCPPLGLAWLALVWAGESFRRHDLLVSDRLYPVRPANAGVIFALMAFIGVCSLPLLPISLELAVEVTRNADASSALLFFGSNVLNVVFLAIENALRAGPSASPPLNMKNALLFQGVIILVVCLTILAIRGEQTRRGRDVAMANAETIVPTPVDLSQADSHQRDT